MRMEQIAKIKVIGVGGAGCNAVNRMVEEGMQGVEFYVANTDLQVLNVSKCENKLVLGQEITKGLGAGSNPEIGAKAAEESQKEIRDVLEGADMVFIAAGLGGGTGTGAAPIIAKISQDLGALTVAIVTKPFRFEGKRRIEQANNGLLELKQHIDSLIIVSNDLLLQEIGSIPIRDSFREADNVLRQGVQTITDLIAVPAMINLDFADVSTVMKNKGAALIGIGMSKGENKAREAAESALNCRLLEANIRGAQNAIVNITGGENVSLFDADLAMEYIREAAGSDVNIIFGVAINENLGDSIIVTVIATGFDDNIIAPNVQKTVEKAVTSSFKATLNEQPKQQEEVTSIPSFFNFNK